MKAKGPSGSLSEKPTRNAAKGRAAGDWRDRRNTQSTEEGPVDGASSPLPPLSLGKGKGERARPPHAHAHLRI